MYRIDLYLFLNLPNAPHAPGECHKLPMAPEAIQEALGAALAAGQPPLRTSVIPVVTDRPPEPALIAAIAWATGSGRYLPIEYYEVRSEEDIGNVANAIIALQGVNDAAPEPSDDDYLLGGLKIHGIR